MKNFSVDFLDQVRNDIDGLKSMQRELIDSVDWNQQKLDLVLKKKAQL